MLRKILPLARSLLGCGLVLSGIGLGSLPPARATDSVRQLEKKLNKVKKKTKKAVRTAARIFLEGVSEVGAVIAIDLAEEPGKAAFEFDCTGAEGHHPKSHGEHGPVLLRAASIAAPAAPTRSAVHAAEAVHSAPPAHKPSSTGR
jgi:hypothetical protein